MTYDRAVVPSPRHRTFSALVVLIAVLAPALSRAREPERFSAWPDDTALTLREHRIALGLSSQSAWGAHRRFDVRLHPLLFWVLPHVEVKVRWLDDGRWQLSSAHRVGYPTPFLSLVSREGSGGLLPPTTSVPHALSLDNDVLGSAEWRDGQWATLRAGAAVAWVGSGDETVLDFPILYQRFAALYAPIVPRLSLVASGLVAERLSYNVEFKHYWLPLHDQPLRHANEYFAEVYLRLGQNHRLGAGGRLSVARLPVGLRSHFLPHLDYQFGF